MGGVSAWRRAAPWLVVGIGAVVASIVILDAGRGLTFFFDEWDFILHRRENTLDDFLVSHNGHLAVFPVAIYRVMWAIFGLDSYVPYRVLTVVLHLVCAGLLFVYLRRRAPEWFAVAATIVILFLGYAWQDLIWPFQMSYFLSIAAGLAALLLLDRRDRIGDIGTAVALAIGLGSSGLGIAFALAVGFELAMRRETWTRLWVPLAPLVLYGIWYLQWGASQARSSNIDLVPSYTARAGAASVGALAGTTLDNGRYLVGALATVMVVVLVQRRTIPLRMATVLVLTLGYWVLTAIGRGHLQEPGASRYLYPGAVMVVLVVAELVRDLRVRQRTWAIVLSVALVVGVGLSIRGNLRELDAGAAGLRGVSDIVRAELAALELARGQVPDDFQPDAQYMPPVTAGDYFAARHAYGSPALTPRELRNASEPLRTRADGVIARALGATLTPVNSSTTAPANGMLTVVRHHGGDLTTAGSCVVLTPSAGAASLDVEDETIRLRIDAAPGVGADVGVRALGTVDAAPLGSIEPGTSATLSLPRFRTGPWQVQVVSQGPVQVCPTG